MFQITSNLEVSLPLASGASWVVLSQRAGGASSTSDAAYVVVGSADDASYAGAQVPREDPDV